MVKVDTYNGINAYLSELSDTCIKSVEDIVRYNENNNGTEGAYPGDHQAFASGQVRSCVLSEVPANSFIRTIFEKFAIRKAGGMRLICKPWNTHKKSPAQRASTPH